jgi:hypothetical protein
VEELAARAKLKDDVVILTRFGEVYELDNVRMVKLAHDLDFLENVGTLREERGCQPRVVGRDLRYARTSVG